MKIVSINSRPTMADALETIDGLRKDIESGKIVSFFAAGVGDNDDTYAYVGSAKPVSRLRMTGAMAHALHMFQHDEV